MKHTTPPPKAKKAPVPSTNPLAVYYNLAKPGIIYGNILTGGAGFLLGAQGHGRLAAFVGTLLGMALVIGCACVANNYIDRGIDKHMGRTKHRALVEGMVTGRAALTYATVLGVVGFALLIWQANWLTVLLGLLALVDYVVLYGYTKRTTVYGTLVGSIAGALPMAAGYTAASGRFDTGALLLFVIMACWQMPHFYAIAMFRRGDYAAAGLPVLPVAQGMQRAKVHIVAYIIAFVAAATLLTAFNYTGLVYLVVVGGLGVLWFYKGISGFKAGTDDTRWARSMFFFSLIVMAALSVMAAIDVVLP
jgi:protoheme IX farnesyltransferase